MNDEFYMLIQGNEDGHPNRILVSIGELEDLLEDPEETFGVTEFKNLKWFCDNEDPNYWPNGVAVLLQCALIVPVPSGKLRLP